MGTAPRSAFVCGKGSRHLLLRRAGSGVTGGERCRSLALSLEEVAKPLLLDEMTASQHLRANMIACNQEDI